MKKMKFLALALSISMMGSAFVACQQPAKPAESKAEVSASQEVAEKAALKVGVFYYNYADTFISSVRAAVDEQFKAAGLDFQNFDGANNQTTQSEQIDTALAQGFNLLLVNIVNTKSEDAALEVVKKAKEVGAQVIFFNREVTDKTVKEGEGKVAFVGTDAPEAGHLQGKMVGDYVLANYDAIDLNKDGKISYMMLMGELGNAEAIARTEFGVKDADAVLTAANKPALEFYDAKNTDKYKVDPDGAWSAKAASEIMTTAFAEYNEANKNMIELVIANNDGMAMGAIEALGTLGFNTGDAKFIPVFGVDATAEAVAAIQAKKMVGTVKQSAEGMATSLMTLVQNANNGKVLMDGVREKLIVDQNVDKIRVPYEVVQ